METETTTMTMSSCPSTPRWNVERPFLTGRFHQVSGSSSSSSSRPGPGVGFPSNGTDKKAIGCYDAALQELIVIDELLSAMVGIQGQYISIQRLIIRGKKDDGIAFHLDASMDISLQEMAKRMFPLCESYLLIVQFVESTSQFKNGLVNHAFAAALRALLLEFSPLPQSIFPLISNISFVCFSALERSRFGPSFLCSLIPHSFSCTRTF